MKTARRLIVDYSQEVKPTLFVSQREQDIQKWITASLERILQARSEQMNEDKSAH